jgi:hypothetical protein
MLHDIRIASPCPAKWEQMAGDDRIRWCAACNLNVYNLAELTEREIRQLLARREGRLCVRLYQRRDGTTLTRDCPVGVRAAMRRLSRVAGALFSTLALPFVGTAQSLQSNAPQSDGPKPSLVWPANHETGIAVVVIDSENKVVPSAKITLVEEGGRKRKIKGNTDLTGRFLRTDLSPGNYRIRIDHERFTTYKGMILIEEHAIANLEVKLIGRPVTITVGQI